MLCKDVPLLSFFIYYLTDHILVTGIVLLDLFKRYHVWCMQIQGLCSMLSPWQTLRKKKTFSEIPLTFILIFLQVSVPNLWNRKWHIGTFPALYPGLWRRNFTHSYVFPATLQGHLITMISTCSLWIPWKPQSPWVKSKWLIHKAIQLAVNLESVSLHLFSAHLLFVISAKYKSFLLCWQVQQ